MAHSIIDQIYAFFLWCWCFEFPILTLLSVLSKSDIIWMRIQKLSRCFQFHLVVHTMIVLVYLLMEKSWRQPLVQHCSGYVLKLERFWTQLTKPMKVCWRVRFSYSLYFLSVLPYWFLNTMLANFSLKISPSFLHHIYDGSCGLVMLLSSLFCRYIWTQFSNKNYLII